MPHPVISKSSLMIGLVILSLDKGEFQSVRIIENGKDIKHLPPTPPLAPNPGNSKPSP